MPGPSAQPAPDRGSSQPPRIAVLIAGGPLAHALVNGLLDHFGPVSVLREEPEPKLAILRRRARLVGWPEALGQAAFGVVQKLISRRSAARLAAIWEEHGLDPCLDCGVAAREIGSGNPQTGPTALRELSPAVVVVYGTRIIKGETLRCVRAPFINYHAGINPKYRGQNGA